MTRFNRKTALTTVLQLITVEAVLVTVAGCYTSHVTTPRQNAGDVRIARNAEPAAAFSYSKEDVPFTNHVDGVGVTSPYELRLLEIPSVGDNGQKDNLVTAKYYRSVLPGSHPLVIVLPIWGTYTYPPRKITAAIQRHSEGAVHVLWVQGEDYLADWDGLVATTDRSEFLDLWREAVERQKVAIIDTRRLIDWAEDRPEIDNQRIGLIGFSLSAVVAGTIATQEPRLAATVTVMGGAHLHTILSTCDGKRATRVQVKASTAFGWNREEFEAQLEPIMAVLDAASYANQVDPQSVLIVDAARDKCVPENSREDLWLALGRPERITMNYDHSPAFYSMTPLGNNWLRRRIWEFFESRLLP